MNSQPPVSPDIPIAILAAGSSTRLGRPKQLLPWRGETLLRSAIREALTSACGPVVTLLGAHADIIHRTIEDLPVHIVHHREWSRGMGSTLRQAVQFVRKHWPASKALVIAVSDQPLMRATHLRTLVETYYLRHPLLVASEYHGIHGVPALFDARLFDLLEQVPDKEGAQKLICRISSRITIPFPEGAFDVDTVDDLEKLQHLKTNAYQP